MYKCTTCGELFYSRVDCDEHIESIHPDTENKDCIRVRYRCPQCDRSFGHRSDVRNHALREHGDQRVEAIEDLVTTS